MANGDARPMCIPPGRDFDLSGPPSAQAAPLELLKKERTMMDIEAVMTAEHRQWS